MNRIVIIFWGLMGANLAAQNFNCPSNPYYWKNKKPYPNYWQQDIHYTINAQLDPKNEIISGDETIQYSNNSPDTLHELFFNLYQNAFIKNSYLTNLQEANGQKVRFGKWEAQDKGNEILKLAVNGQKIDFEIDGSIMRARLPQPLLPGKTLEINIDFKTYYSLGGTTRRRMKSYVYQNRKHFNGAHWYPRLAVYDRKFKWCTDQHLNREFYGDFGHYNVKLTFPADYVVEATGVLQNRTEVLPDSLRKKLDLSNYTHLKWDTAVTFFQKIDSGATKTWHYLAENVHDFAWIAGPHYRIHDSTANGYQVVAMVLEPHASGWTSAVDFTHRVMEVYSRDIGKYAYPKMVVADCQDGMEYPMLTMDGGAEPGYRKLLAHEVGHNWFYGMVNNNETYRAMLDEGFTQFLTVWALEAIDGKYTKRSKTNNKLLEHFHEPNFSREANIYNGYMYDAMRHQDPTLNTHSDGFNGALGQGGGYGHVYTKTATMLYNLQYTLGDSLFLKALQNYFNQWSFCHPYIEDFKQSIIDYTKVDLNWFFDQWIETSKHIDYKLFKPKLLDSAYNYQITLKRKGDMQMPIDLTFRGKSGKRYHFYIPNTWWEKSTPAQPLKRWIGWDNKLNTTYTTQIKIGEPLLDGTIDTTRRLADINALNNCTKLPIKWRLDHQLGYTIDRNTYNINYRPDIWYNNTDGFKVGLHLDGNYMREFHDFEFDFWVNTTLGRGLIQENNLGNQRFDPISFRASYSTPIHKILKDGNLHLSGRWLEGVGLGKVSISKWFSPRLLSFITFKSFGYTHPYSLNYLYNPSMASAEGVNSSLSIGGKFFHKLLGMNSASRLDLRSSLLSSSAYSYAQFENQSATRVGTTTLRIRSFGRLGLSSQNLGASLASMLQAGGANAEEMLENEFMRAVNFFPAAMHSEAISNGRSLQLHHAGGTNLRGYSMRSAVVHGGQSYSLLGQNSGFTGNLEWHFHSLSPFKFRKLAPYLGLETYLFADAGRVGNLTNRNKFYDFSGSPLLADAGLGIALHVKRWGYFQKVNPIYIRLDMPLYLSHPNLQDNDKNIALRWMIGIGRGF